MPRRRSTSPRAKYRTRPCSPRSRLPWSITSPGLPRRRATDEPRRYAGRRYRADPSVGGKTGINPARGKNLVGVFHQPRLVLADTAVLDSLPARQFRAGYAEIAKIGLIGDPAFFAWLEQNWRSVFAGGADRDRAIAVACRAKAAPVMADE